MSDTMNLAVDNLDNYQQDWVEAYLNKRSSWNLLSSCQGADTTSSIKQEEDQPPNGAIHKEGPWYRYQGWLTRYSRLERVWFARTEQGQPGVRLTDADFQPIIQEEEREGLTRQSAEEEPKPQIKEETPEPNTLSFFPDNDDDDMCWII